MIDYEKEYYNLVKTRGITSMPSQDIINGNKKMAIYVWNNILVRGFDEYYNISLVNDYHDYDIKNIFIKYKDDIDFWTTIIKVEENFNLLFIDKFKKDFKFAYESLVNDKDLIKEIYINAHKFANTNKLFSLLSEDYKKLAFAEKAKKGNFTVDFVANNLDMFDEDTLIDYIASGANQAVVYYSLSDEQKNDVRFLSAFLNDENWGDYYKLSEENRIKMFNKEKILKHLKNNINIYNSLPEEKKNDLEYIKVFLTNKNWDNFFELSHENQNKIFNEIKKWHIGDIKAHKFNNFQKSHLDIFINENKFLLETLLSNDFNKWYPLYEEKAKENILNFNPSLIFHILKQNEDMIDDVLKTFKTLSERQEDYRLLSIINKAYPEKIEEYRNIYIDIILKKEITPNEFEKNANELMEQYRNNEVDENTTKALLVNLKKLLPHKILKIIRVSDKDLFDKLLNQENIFENLPSNKVNKP